VIRFRLPQGLNFNDPISINAHVGHVIQNLNRGLCTMGGWEGTVLRLDQATVTFHSPSSPIISALAGIVTIVAGPHKDEKITRLPIYVVAPDKYELKRGTRVELKLPINSVDIDPPAIVSALVAVSSTQLNPRKGDITVAYVAFCSAARPATPRRAARGTATTRCTTSPCTLALATRRSHALTTTQTCTRPATLTGGHGTPRENAPVSKHVVMHSPPPHSERGCAYPTPPG
jgi:hypothetical protein